MESLEKCCLHCGKMFSIATKRKHKTQLCCSRRCSAKHRHGDNKPLEKRCPSCDKLFEVPYKRRARKFCSQSCGTSYRYRNKPVVEFHCPGCDKLVKFSRPSEVKSRKFCSVSCSMKHVRKLSPILHYKSSKCDACGEEFYKTSSTQRWCKKCAPDKIAQARMSKYGLSDPQFQKMLEDQVGKCAVCETPLSGKTYLDHDHTCCPGICSCGKCVRGILCSACNNGLAYIDKEGWPERAEAYRKRYALKRAICFPG